MRSEGGKPSDKPTFPALAVGHHLGIRVFRPPSQQPAGREGDISATFRCAGPLQRLAKSPPGEFLEPPRGFWNEHGDASGVPAKTNTFQAKPAPVWSGFWRAEAIQTVRVLWGCAWLRSPGPRRCRTHLDRTHLTPAEALEEQRQVYNTSINC